jgi:hypothetical protein
MDVVIFHPIKVDFQTTQFFFLSVAGCGLKCLPKGIKGMNLDVTFWYSLYAGFFPTVIDSEKSAEAWNKRIRDMQPAIDQFTRDV